MEKIYLSSNSLKELINIPEAMLALESMAETGTTIITNKEGADMLYEYDNEKEKERIFQDAIEKFMARLKKEQNRRKISSSKGKYPSNRPPAKKKRKK